MVSLVNLSSLFVGIKNCEGIAIDWMGRNMVVVSLVNLISLIAGIKNCEGIAIDWMGRNIFWTDETQKTISVAKLDDTSIQRVVISETMAHPRAIVVDPRRGKG